jgi:hypothetical protein
LTVKEFGDQQIDSVEFDWYYRLVGFYGNEIPGKNISSIGIIKTGHSCRKQTEVEKSIKSFFFVILTIVLILLGILLCIAGSIVGIYFYLHKK